MKTKYLKYTPPLLVALLASSGASATTYNLSSTVSGTFQKWTESTPGVLTNTDNTTSLDNLMAGNASAPGGNIQLVTLSGVAETLSTTFDNGKTLTLSSLTAADWGTPNSGGLLDIWSQQVISTYPHSGVTLAVFEAGMTAHSNYLETVFGNPNISYANLDGNGAISIGIAGYYDIGTILGASYAGDKISKIVKASYNGSTPEYLFSMGSYSATQSGVYAIIPNQPNAFTGNYEVKIPEPSSLALLFAGLTGFLGLRRKAVTA